jgi:hypothetical protein
LVHLGLLVSVAAAFGTLQLLHIQKAWHVGVGLAFAALVVAHLVQRRHRIARMFARLGDHGERAQRQLRLLTSDSVLAFLGVNVVVSGVLDWARGGPLQLPLPKPFQRWHLASSAVLVVYLVVHVSRCWGRLRRSSVR